MKPVQRLLIAMIVCLEQESTSNARPCCVPARRVATLSAVEVDQAVFAAPVATVVFAVQPAVLYSYREAARPAPLPVVPTQSTTAHRGATTAEAVLRQHCVQCHSGDAPRGGVSFFAADGTLEPLLPRRAILEMATPSADAPAKMPPGEAQKLGDAEIELLRAWAEPPRDLRY